MSNTFTTLLLSCLILLAACQHHEEETQLTSGNALPFSEVGLNNLSAFTENTGENWQLSGNVYANRQEKHHIQPSEGSGILVNLPSDNSGAHLLTAFEHGDIDVELDFLMPKGSGSGIFLQGRYEVQLADSWLANTLTFEDCGGIYQPAGQAPTQNATKAPGLWQHLFIRFRAPQFDASGKKTTNAVIERVVLNGRVIQEEVEVSAPTQAAAFQEEKPTGPLVFQGNQGPVAFKNIRYKKYEDRQLQLQEMQFRVYKGMFTNLDTLSQLEPIQSGKTDSLSYRVVNENAAYTVVFEGPLHVPTAGDYLFKLQAFGPVWLHIDDKLVTDNDAANHYDHAGYGVEQLSEGEHSFRLTYVNLVPWNKKMGLSYEGPGIPTSRLTTTASEPEIRTEPPLLIEVENQPVLQRGFINHQEKKKTHTAAIGMPGEVNYAYDFKNNNILSAWRGGFVEVTDMWDGRGEKQLEKPLGAVLEFTGLPAVAHLDQQKTPWPDSIELENSRYSNRGYRLRKNGLPVFLYQVGQVAVEDFWHPVEQEKGLTRELSFQFHQGNENIYCLIASGSLIEELPNGSYAVDGKAFYIDRLESSQGKPFIRQQQNRYELLLPVIPQAQKATVKYSVIW